MIDQLLVILIAAFAILVLYVTTAGGTRKISSFKTTSYRTKSQRATATKAKKTAIRKKASKKKR